MTHKKDHSILSHLIGYLLMESQNELYESFKVSASSSALDFESSRTQLFFDSVP